MRSFCFEIIYGILLIVQKGHSTPDGQRVALNGHRAEDGHYGHVKLWAPLLEPPEVKK